MPVFDTFTIQAPNTSDTTRAFALRQEALNNLMKPLNGFADLAKNFTMAQQSQEAAEAQALIRAAMARGKNVEEMRQLGAQVSQQIDPRIWANAQGDKLVDKEIDRYITDSTDRRNWSANNRSWFDSMDRARLNDYIAQEVHFWFIRAGHLARTHPGDTGVATVKVQLLSELVLNLVAIKFRLVEDVLGHFVFLVRKELCECY